MTSEKRLTKEQVDEALRGVEVALPTTGAMLRAHIAAMTQPVPEDVARDADLVCSVLHSVGWTGSSEHMKAAVRLRDWAAQGHALAGRLERSEKWAEAEGQRAHRMTEERDALQARVKELEIERAGDVQMLEERGRAIDSLKARAEAAERKAAGLESERDAYKRDLQAEADGNAALRQKFGALEHESFPMFVERLATDARRFREACERAKDDASMVRVWLSLPGGAYKQRMALVIGWVLQGAATGPGGGKEACTCPPDAARPEGFHRGACPVVYAESSFTPGSTPAVIAALESAYAEDMAEVAELQERQRAARELRAVQAQSETAPVVKDRCTASTHTHLCGRWEGHREPHDFTRPIPVPAQPAPEVVWEGDGVRVLADGTWEFFGASIPEWLPGDDTPHVTQLARALAEAKREARNGALLSQERARKAAEDMRERICGSLLYVGTYSGREVIDLVRALPLPE